jgi:effector-binding domain-containing protein
MQIRGMLHLKQAELQQHIQGETARLARVEACLRQIEQENDMPDYEVVLKTIQPITVASLRETLPKYAAVGSLFNELYDYLYRNEVKLGNYCIAIWHDAGYKERDVDAEAVVSADKFLPKCDRIKVYELPGNGYRIVGPNREVYIQGGQEQDNESYVTKIQFPVEKI